MKTKKSFSTLMLCVMVLTNFSIENSFSMTIHVEDTTLYGFSQYVFLPDGDDLHPDITVSCGKTLNLIGYSRCILKFKLEGAGWGYYPLKADRVIKISWREQPPAVLNGGTTLAETRLARRRYSKNYSSAVSGVNKIVLVDLPYPYGKPKIYLNGSLFITAARLAAMGYEVSVVDLNMDSLDDPEVREKIRLADRLGVSVIGSPYIPSALRFAQEAEIQVPIMLGGQVIERLGSDQFVEIFPGVYPQRISCLAEFSLALRCEMEEIPSAYEVSLIPVLRKVERKNLEAYLRREMTLVVSQGCKYNCDFCAASKAMKETFRHLEIFEADLQYLAREAKSFGLQRLEFYASSLDAFQNPLIFTEYLKVLARVQKEEGVEIRVRCLSCAESFLETFDQVPDLAELIPKAGVWCIGFGGDGVDEEVWKAQNKWQNTEENVRYAIAKCHEIGVRPELLMVLGFPEDGIYTLGKTLVKSFWYTLRWSKLVLRPYLAKDIVPGNKGWKKMANQERVREIADNPELFYNLDFCAIASPTSHPGWWKRWTANFVYLAIIFLLGPIGRCATSPLLPQGVGGLYGRIAKWVNKRMPFDR